MYHSTYGNGTVTTAGVDPCEFFVDFDIYGSAPVPASELSIVSCPSSSGSSGASSASSGSSGASSASSGASGSSGSSVASSSASSGSGAGGYEYSLQDCDNSGMTHTYKSPDDIGVAGAGGVFGTVFYDSSTQTCWHITNKNTLTANEYAGSSATEITSSNVVVYGVNNCQDCFDANNCQECDLCEQFYDSFCTLTGTAHNTNSYWWDSATAYTSGQQVVHWTNISNNTTISVYEANSTNFNNAPNAYNGVGYAWTKVCVCSCDTAQNGEQIFPCTP